MNNNLLIGVDGIIYNSGSGTYSFSGVFPVDTTLLTTPSDVDYTYIVEVICLNNNNQRIYKVGPNTPITQLTEPNKIYQWNYLGVQII